MKLFTPLLILFFSQTMLAQTASVKGQLQDDQNEPVVFANVSLYASTDSSLVKVETSSEIGIFDIRGIKPGSYFLKATFVGLSDFEKPDLRLEAGQNLDLGILQFSTTGTDLDEVTVTADRAIVEVKADRTVFNVQGTINSVGEDALSLLRKAPGVTVDNNDNINVLGRAGVRLFVDGKQLPLAGDDLSAYLQNLPAEQIDRIDIITSPGAKYEAEGNAGIIDIRLKRDKNMGGNGSLSGTYSKGRHHKYNLSGTGNYRNKAMNIFGNASIGESEGFHDMDFDSYQNELRLNESNEMFYERKYVNLRLGTDFFVGKKHTIGFLVSGGDSDRLNDTDNIMEISQQSNPNSIDSILVANNEETGDREYQTFNVNYRFDIDKGKSLNIDLDFGNYDNTSQRFQPNRYFNAEQDEVLTEVINYFDTPTEIDIYTGKVDYEHPLLGGQLGLGTKLSRVVSKNTFLYYDQYDGENNLNNERSNQFDYTENVYAGYFSYNRPINQKWNFSSGLRMEVTDATGNLQAFIPDLMEPPVELNYTSWFPNAGLNWTPKQNHSFNLNYGRRINRPDYNVLNPFNNRLSELSYQKGNPFLRPEIVNNIELGYTLKYRYNFKLAYSNTEDQITRLIAPDDNDDRASFITWDNLANQKIISLSISAPVQLTKVWNAYFNASASHKNNQADYGNGAIVDLQIFTYTIFQQHTFDLPGGFKGEVSCWFNGPGIWGGVFEHEEMWSLSLGLQKKLLQDKLNIKLSANDIFYKSGWDGFSEFNGLRSIGSGRFDSRRVGVSLSYNFGNQNVKSRKRKTSLEEESKRVGSGG